MTVWVLTQRYGAARQSLALDARPHNVGVGIIHPGIETSSCERGLRGPVLTSRMFRLGNVRSNLLSADEIARREALEGFIEPV